MKLPRPSATLPVHGTIEAPPPPGVDSLGQGCNRSKDPLPPRPRSRDASFQSPCCGDESISCSLPVDLEGDEIFSTSNKSLAQRKFLSRLLPPSPRSRLSPSPRVPPS